MVELKTGKGHYMAIYHLGEKGRFTVYKVLSTDGGVTGNVYFWHITFW